MREFELKCQQLVVYILGTLIYLSFTMPRIMQEIKALLIFLLLTLLYTVNINSVKLMFCRSKFMCTVIVYIIYAFLSAYIGVIHDNPGVIDFIRVKICYFIIFLLLLPCIHIKKIEQILLFVMFLSMLHIVVYNIILLLTPALPFLNFIKIFDATPIFQYHSGYLHLITTNCSMLIFLIPLFLSLFCNGYKIVHVNKAFFALTLVAAIMIGILTGRRIIWLIIILSIILQLSKISYKSLIIFIILIIIPLSMSGIFTYEGISSRMANAFLKTDVKYQQMVALWKGFLDFPLFGSGAGIGVENVIRNELRPWTYELSYNLILYNSGIIGTFAFIMYLFLLLYYLRYFIKQNAINKKVYLGMHNALLMSIIANATNPYFSSSFDFLWMLYIPMIYIYIGDIHMYHTELRYKKDLSVQCMKTKDSEIE